MGGDDSQKLLPWRGIHSSPGPKPPAHYRINTVTETTVGILRLRLATTHHPRPVSPGPQLQTAWVIFGKHWRVISGARRRKVASAEIARINGLDILASDLRRV